MDNINLIKLDVDIDEAGSRLDVYLSNLLQEFSRSRIQQLIKEGCVQVNEKPSKNSYKLKYCDEIAISNS